MKNNTSIFIKILLVFFLALNSSKTKAQVPFPGKVIAQSTDPANINHGSPGIAILPDDTYVASHDWGGSSLAGVHTSVYRSVDKGENWILASVVRDVRWASLFYHNGSLYLMGVVAGINNITIRKSDDGGSSWTKAEDNQTGLLVIGRFHTAPTPVVVHNGRIWKAYEESPILDDDRDFHAFVMSAPVGADLLKASSWARSNIVALNSSWLNADTPEWCEGNVVVTPEGNIANIIRIKTDQPVNGTLAMSGYAAGIPRYEVAAKIDISADGLTASFNPSTGFIHFPGAITKFTIRYDALSGKYWSIVNKITTVVSGWSNASSNGPWNQRNVMILSSSSDLLNWEERYKVIRWNEGDIITRRVNFGFQYADWQFDGDDIVAAVRTSWYGSDFHDANMLTFHRLANFRTLTMADSPADIGYLTEGPGNILSWQFGNPQTAGTETTVNSTETNPSLNVSILSRGSGLLNTVVLNRSFASSSATQHNSKTSAISNNEYFQFEVEAKTGHQVSLATIDAKLSRNSTGARSYRWAFSKDGTNFTEIGSGEVFNLIDTDEEGVVQAKIHLEMYKELQNIPSNQKVTFRMYVWGSTNSSGRFSIGRYESGNTTPSLAIGGTVIPMPAEETPLVAWSMSAGSAIPEIKSAKLLSSTLSRGAGLTTAGLSRGFYSTMSSASKDDAMADNSFYKMTLQANSGQYVSLNKLLLKLRRNSTGPNLYRLFYSKDDVNFIEIGKSDIPFLDNSDLGAVQPLIDLSEIADLQNVSSTQTITFRLYAWGATAAAGGFGLGRYTDGNCIAIYGTTNENIVAAWEFSGENGRQNNDPATTLNPNIEPSGLIRGNNVAATESSGNSFVGNFPISATKQQAIDNGNYFQFTIKTKSGYKTSLSSLDARIRVQANAANHYSWRYSTDGVSFYDAGLPDNTINTTVNDGQAVPQIDLSAIAHLQNVTSGKTITFRIYAWGGTATTTSSFGIGKSLAGANALILGGSVVEEEGVLPVELTYFNGEQQGNNINLKWNTASEKNNSHFNVLKSNDGINFFVLGDKQASSSLGDTYHYLDANPHIGFNYYQLQQADINGATVLSKILAVPFNFSKEKLSVYARHDDQVVKLFINSSASVAETIKIVDLLGKVLANVPVKLQEGLNTINLPLSLPVGVYVAVLTSSSGAIKVKFRNE